jgi:hypothetical protein
VSRAARTPTAARFRRAGRWIAAWVAGLALAGCEAPRYETNWSRLRVGMTREQVGELLGDPSSRHRPKYSEEERLGAAASGGAIVTERWQYGDTLSSLATGALMPREADERTWCVFFGPDGKLTEFRGPAWNPGPG